MALEGMDFEEDGVRYRVHAVVDDGENDCPMALYYERDEHAAGDMQIDDCERAPAEHVESLLPTE
jgi:hypothetical protein